MKKIIHTKNAPSPIGPYSQAVRAGHMIYLSGQIAINPESEEIAEGSIADETNQIMKNIAAILNAEGLDFGAVIKTSIFLTDMAFFSEVNSEYAKWFQADFPARETVQVSGLPKGVRVEISMIAFDNK
jgi:2-iminobutanoate/2-iminopropanoate deaminase